jgi:ABC-type lipoprotein release transport system permease subunit
MSSTMIQLYKMAFRDLGRNRRRSFFSALALAMGLALLLLIASVLEGEMRGALESNIRLNSGHLQVRAASYNEDKTSLKWEDLIENPAEIAAKIAALEPVKVATPRLFASGIISSNENTVGVRILGIEPASKANAPFREGMINGEFLTADDRQGVLLGQPLAEKLNLKTGDTVQLLANTSNGDVDEQPFVVRGVYSTHIPGFDESTVFMPLLKAQAITKTENHASAVFVLLKDRADAAAVAAALPTSQYQVKTWEQMNELIVQFEQFASAYMSLIYLIILAITATVIINTLIMSVYERTREIGILAAIGMKGSRIMAMFFAESSLLAVGGILMGLVIGGVLVYFASNTGFFIGNVGMTGFMLGERIYVHLTINDAITLTILAFIVSLLAALYPALLAARMEPVEALHSGQ